MKSRDNATGAGGVANCDQFIEQQIYSIRGMQVMLDRDHAGLCRYAEFSHVKCGLAAWIR